MSEPPFRPEHFRRMDERDDRLFYAAPRLVTHIDEHAIEAVRRLYEELLPPAGALLDLMSSWKSHLPPPAPTPLAGEGRAGDQPPRRRVVGLGLNETELRENDQLDARVVHDVNDDPRLPFVDGEFDAAVMAVSVQYLMHPVEVFREVRRVLRPGGPFVVTYSNRLFPEKAVAVWCLADAAQRARLIGAYFRHAGGWDEITAQDRSPRPGFPTDPLYVVWARAAKDGP